MSFEKLKTQAYVYSMNYKTEVSDSDKQNLG